MMKQSGNTKTTNGNTYYGIDDNIRDRLRSKLMRAVLCF